jgi:hypothetical protein
VITEGIWVLSLIVIYAVWTFGIRPLEVAKTRSQLFELRHLLFKMGCENEIEFSSVSYRMVEDYLNAIIRNAHKVTFFRVLIMWSVVRKNSWAFDSVDNLIKTIDGIPNKKVSKNLKFIHILGMFLITRQLCMSFFPTWVVFMVMRMFSLMKTENQKKMVVSRFEKPVKIIEADALTLVPC